MASPSASFTTSSSDSENVTNNIAKHGGTHNHVAIQVETPGDTRKPDQSQPSTRTDVLYGISTLDANDTARRFYIKDRPWDGIDSGLADAGASQGASSQAVITHFCVAKVAHLTDKKGNTLENWKEEPADFALGRDADIVESRLPELMINSKSLVRVLEKILDYYPDHLGPHDFYPSMLKNTFVEIMHCYAELKFYFNTYVQSLPQDARSSPRLYIGECGDDAVLDAVRSRLDFGTLDVSNEPCDEATAHDTAVLLRLLAPMYRSRVVPSLTSLYCQSEPTVSYEGLWCLLKPGTRVYVRQSAFSDTNEFLFRNKGTRGFKFEGHLACVVASWRYEDKSTTMDRSWFEAFDRLIVCLWNINHDGTRFQRIGRQITIFKFPGSQSLKRLELFPDNLLESIGEGMLRENLRARGKKFISMLKEPAAHREYNDPQSGYRGQIIVDTSGFSQAIRDSAVFWHPSMRDDTTLQVDAHMFSPVADGGGGDTFLDITNFEATDSENYKRIEEVYILLPPILYGFGLKTKKWMMLNIEHLSNQPPKPAPNQLDNELMLISDADRDALRTVLPRDQQPVTVTSDFVAGKGEGKIFLLYGPPGTGKTLTVECVANDTRRPLLTLTSEDFGGERDVESRLRTWFTLASKWDSILLIDEADVFLEQRREGYVDRNKLATIFLRTMEYYKGILFLTTNRPGHIDDSFISRITYPIKYEPLTLDMKKRIIDRFVRRFENTNKVEVDSAAKAYLVKNCQELNGRQIRNVLQNSVASADVALRAERAERHREGATEEQPDIVLVRWQHVKAAVERQTQFKLYLDKMKNKDEATRAKARHDWAS